MIFQNLVLHCFFKRPPHILRKKISAPIILILNGFVLNDILWVKIVQEDINVYNEWENNILLKLFSSQSYKYQFK